jgi:predicted NBD/HSP70 family sugar kinase
MTVHFRRTSVMPAVNVAVRQQSLRSHNLTLVFHQVVEARENLVSRAQIAAATGLTRATVSRIVDQLIAGRLVTETRPLQPMGIGRPPVGLVLSRQGPAGLGLGVRADQLSACVVDLTGAVRYLEVVPCAVAMRPAEQVLADIAAMATAACAAASSEKMTIAGVMLAVPGLIDKYRTVRLASTLRWRDVDVVAALERAIDGQPLRVAVDNEANLAATGEFYTDEELEDFVYVSGETEVGAGTFLDGRLLRGTRGWSGALGHVVVYPDGLECRCGSRGCLQSYASLDVLSRAESGSGAAPATTAVEIAARADAGSPATLLALQTAATALGIAISNIVTYVDVDTVVLGGSYAVLASWLLDGVRKRVAGQGLTSEFLRVEVRPSLLGADAAVIGAGLTVIDEIRSRPPDWLLGEETEP